MPSDLIQSDLWQNEFGKIESIPGREPIEHPDRERFGDDTKLQIGETGTIDIFYDSADDRHYIDVPDGGKVCFRPKGGFRRLIFDAANKEIDYNWPPAFGNQPIRGGRHYTLTAQDSAPNHREGRVVLASPSWDPDGDGNGEIVCSDGSAWNEVVDLPNYT